jgi:hypothetical protein
LLHLFHTAQSDASLSTCFLWRHTATQIIVNMHLKKAIELSGKITVAMA